MPTNDERRQVAARLREEAERHCDGFDPLALMDALGIDMDAEPFCDGFRRYCDLATFETWNRLADLIEPLPERTCKPTDPFDKETKHIVERGLSHYYWPYKGCPECQRDFPQGSNFCPICGARVVD